MNKEHRISKEGGASRHVFVLKKTAPAAHHPSTFLVRYSLFDILFFPFLLHSLKKISCRKTEKFQTKLPTTHYLLPTTYYPLLI
jgi:hypothetical protein